MSDAAVWTVIAVLGAGTYLIRLSFLGLIGDRDLPPWVLRYLRYTAVGVLPGLVAPLVLWPPATGGTPDLARGIAALVTLGLGLWRRSVIAAILGGGVTLYGLLALERLLA